MGSSRTRYRACCDRQDSLLLNQQESPHFIFMTPPLRAFHQKKKKNFWTPLKWWQFLRSWNISVRKTLCKYFIITEAYSESVWPRISTVEVLLTSGFSAFKCSFCRLTVLAEKAVPSNYEFLELAHLAKKRANLFWTEVRASFGLETNELEASLFLHWAVRRAELVVTPTGQELNVFVL